MRAFDRSMSSASRTHPLLVTTSHLDELREKCESLSSEAKDGAVAESKLFAQGHFEEQAAGLQQRLEEKLGALGKRVDAGLAELREQLSTALDLAGHKAESTTVENLAAELRKDLADVRASTAQGREELGPLGEQLEALRAEGARTGESLLALAECQQEERRRCNAELEALRSGLQGDLGERASSPEDAVERLQVDLKDKLDALKASRLDVLEQRVSSAAERVCTLEADARGIASIPTRRVEWLLPGASRLGAGARGPILARTPGASQSWWSPRFMVGGQGELQLELQLSRGDAGRGEQCCQLLLWACEGCPAFEAVLRLYVGDAVEELQLRLAEGGSCGTRRWPWRGAADPGDDALRVGMELVEGFQLQDGAVAEAAQPGPDGSAQGGAAPSAGSLSFYRHLCPSTADRVAHLQEQWDSLRSRMVGRVEWRLEQVLMLQQSFPKGECLCSAMFSAGGFDNLQLVFYPSGDQDARACYCSFYLFCPGHSALQCWLSVGKQRREAHRLCARPDFVGRSNFCIFEGAGDRASDSLTLVLEVAEAQQNRGDTAKPTAKTVPWPALANPSVPEPAPPVGTADSVAYDEEVVHNSSRLQGLPGRVSLEDVKQLPAIWTRKPGVAAGGGAKARRLPPVWSYRPPPPACCGQPPEGYLRLAELPGLASVQGGRRSRPQHAQTPLTPRARTVSAGEQTPASPAPRSVPPSTARRPSTSGQAGPL